MREILFRGKRVDNGEWIFGDLYTGLNDEIYINTVVQLTANSRCNIQIMIQKETVGQFTGLTDNNGTKIFEGDTTSNGYVIMWSDKKALFCEHFESKFDSKWSEASYPMQAEGIEIIGNIHENKEQC